MNYLVHLFLAGTDPALQLGGLMGDFVKGPLDDRYPPGLTAGLRLHRAIDSLAATSPHCRASRQRLHPRFGHTRAVLIDIFYDHFLAVHWDEFHPRPLPAFAADIYRQLREQRAILPPGLARIAPRMAAHDWLTSYRDRETVDVVLQRIAGRLSRTTSLAEGGAELERCGKGLLEDFRGFIGEARRLNPALAEQAGKHIRDGGSRPHPSTGDDLL